MSAGAWCFVHISDVQFGMLRADGPGHAETLLAARAVAAINDLQPEFVLCTGDLVDVPGSASQLAAAREALGALAAGTRLVCVPGNHDVGDRPTPDLLQWYRSAVGPDRCAFTHHGWRFVGVDSCLLADPAAAADEAAAQWTWLEATLDAGGRTGPPPTVVFMHHPPYLQSPDEPDDYFNLPGPQRARCLDLLRRGGVRLVLAGHLHRCVTCPGRPPVVVTGPVGMPLGDGCSGFRVVRVSGDSFTHRFFALDDDGGRRRFLVEVGLGGRDD